LRLLGLFRSKGEGSGLAGSAPQQDKQMRVEPFWSRAFPVLRVLQSGRAQLWGTACRMGLAALHRADQCQAYSRCQRHHPLSACCPALTAAITHVQDQKAARDDAPECATCGGTGLEDCACRRWSDGDVGCSESRTLVALMLCLHMWLSHCVPMGAVWGFLRDCMQHAERTCARRHMPRQRQKHMPQLPRRRHCSAYCRQGRKEVGVATSFCALSCGVAASLHSAAAA